MQGYFKYTIELLMEINFTIRKCVLLYNFLYQCVYVIHIKIKIIHHT